MGLLEGKLEAYVGIRVGADLFHDIFSCRPHHVSGMAPEKIKACAVHDGDWGQPGTVINWDYVHDGVAKVAKEVIEDIDDVNLSTTFKVIEGDLMKEYKNFKLVVQATPQSGGEWSLVHWTLEYEKLTEETPDPFSLLQFVVHTSKDIDHHHTKKNDD